MAAAGGQVTVRPIGEADAPIVQRLASHTDIAATTIIPHPYPDGGGADFILRAIEGREKGTDFVFAILADGEFVGVCGIHAAGGSGSGAEIGYWIGRPFWGRGYASKGAAQVLTFAFDERELSVVTSQSLERNRASVRILHRLGFREVARRENDNPKWRDDDVVIRFELTRTDFERHRREFVRLLD